MSKTPIHCRHWSLLCSLFMFIPLWSQAQELNIFYDGEVASAQSMNENFNSLQNQLTQHSAAISAMHSPFNASVDCTTNASALTEALAAHEDKKNIALDLNGTCNAWVLMTGYRKLSIYGVSDAAIRGAVIAREGSHVSINGVDIIPYEDPTLRGGVIEVSSFSSLKLSNSDLTCSASSNIGMIATGFSNMELLNVNLSAAPEVALCGVGVLSHSRFTTGGNNTTSLGYVYLANHSLWENGSQSLQVASEINAVNASFIDNGGSIVANGQVYIGKNSGFDSVNLEVFGDLVIADASEFEGLGGETIIRPYQIQKEGYGPGSLGLNSGSSFRQQAGGLKFIGFEPDHVQVYVIEGSDLVLGAHDPTTIEVNRISLQDNGNANLYGFNSASIELDNGSAATLSGISLTERIEASNNSSLKLINLNLGPDGAINLRNSIAGGNLTSTNSITAACTGLSSLDVSLPDLSNSNCKTSADWDAL